MVDPRTAGRDEIRETVRQRYAAAATSPGCGESGCCGPEPSLGDAGGFGASLYGEEARGAEHAVGSSLGCGVPTQIAALSGGETVLDLGSGGGTDVLIAARQVGPSGRVIGLDMTDEMLELARRNAALAGVENADFRKGHIESIPLPADSVDVVISNCVINLSADKPAVLADAARVLRPGGRFAVADVIADEGMSAATRADVTSWTGCVAGALTERELRDALTVAGFVDVEVVETHRVHEHAGSAIVRARIPDRLAGTVSGTRERAVPRTDRSQVFSERTQLTARVRSADPRESGRAGRPSGL